MRSKIHGRITNAELEVLSILWSRGPSTVRKVHNAVTKLREVCYTTTLKKLQVMSGKGIVKRNETGKAHVYEATFDREETQRSILGDLVERVFNGSVVDLMAVALSATNSPEELVEIRLLLDQVDE